MFVGSAYFVLQHVFGFLHVWGCLDFYILESMDFKVFYIVAISTFWSF